MKLVTTGLCAVAVVSMVHAAADKIDTTRLLVGQAAYLDYRAMKPGTFRKITAGDLPRPLATPSVRNNAEMVPRPANAWPQAPAGFKVDLYSSDVEGPRQVRTAPNGDFFVVESTAGRVKVFRGTG